MQPFDKSVSSFTTTECGVCQLACAMVDKYMFSNMTETEIDAYACLVFPSSWQMMCQNTLNDFLPYMMTRIHEGADGGEICKELHLCRNNHVRAALQRHLNPQRRLPVE